MIVRSYAAFLGAALAIGISTLPAIAGAQPGPPRSFQAPNYPGFAFGSEAGEVLFSLGALAANATALLPQRRTDWAPDAPRPLDLTADAWSDATGGWGGTFVGFGAGYALESAYLADAGVRHGAGVYALHQSIVDVQSTLYTAAIVFGLKRLTGRCRPRDHVPGPGGAFACRDVKHDAFPSGHTAPMGALAGARLITAGLTAGPAGFRWASFGAAEAMALTTAFLRVEAGAHSWSDVAAGLLIGHAVGALVALAHPMTSVPRGDLPGGTGALAEGGFALHFSGPL